LNKVNKLPQSNSNKIELKKINALVNKYLCNFITEKYFSPFYDKDGNEISQNEYSKGCGITSSTLSKIKELDGYNIPLTTVYSICRFENCSLQDFFSEFEKEYGTNIRP
jgi:DNA-binding Xre family transcriptional regulator